MFQEHHDEDLFLYMTYSNESVYGAWGRTKGKKERDWEGKARAWEIELRMLQTTIIIYILIINYSTWWEKGFTQAMWGVAKFLLVNDLEWRNVFYHHKFRSSLRLW